MTYAHTITETPEEIAVQLQQATGKERRRLEGLLWESVKALLISWARGYYNRSRDACKKRGVELDDLTNAQFETIRRAAAAYKAESGLKFSTYLKYHFRNVCAETMKTRTARELHEPLNNCTSLDVPTDTDDPDGSTLKDFVKDPNADFVEDLLQGLDREKEAAAVHAAVDQLPEPLREVVTLHYFDGLTLRQIGKRLEVTGQRVAMIEQEALRRLRQDRRLRLVYLDSEEQKRLARAAAAPTTPDRATATAGAEPAERVNPLLACYMTEANRQALDLLNLMQRETIAAYLAGDTPEQRAADALLEMI